MRLFIAVSLTEITVIGTTLKVTVFQKIFRILRSSCSQVYCHHHIAAGFSGPVHKLIESKLVCLDDPPGQLRSGRTLSFRPDAVLPTESGYKISARITNDRYLKLPYQLQSILPKSLLIRKRAAFLINPLINRTSEMFYKGTIDPFVCFSGEEIFVHDDLRFFHCKNPPVNYYFLLLPHLALFPIPPYTGSYASVRSYTLSGNQPFLCFILPSCSIHTSDYLPKQLTFFPVRFIVKTILPDGRPSVTLLYTSRQKVLYNATVGLSDLRNERSAAFSWISP